jgi:hypothetical protein
VCTALDQCHAQGTCNPATGVCSNPEKADGIACDDGDACTLADSCLAGACNAGNPLTCGVGETCVDGACLSSCTGLPGLPGPPLARFGAPWSALLQPLMQQQ